MISNLATVQMLVYVVYPLEDLLPFYFATGSLEGAVGPFALLAHQRLPALRVGQATRFGDKRRRHLFF